MAENMYVPDDEGENSEEGSGIEHDIDMRTGANQDDYLPPLMRLERYAMADNVYNWQMVGRVALETLRAVADTPEDVRAAMDIINRAAADTEITVRADLIEQLPHIAMVCHEERDKLHFVIEEYLLPLVIKFLGDADNQVRKSTQQSLLLLMEQGLIEMRNVEQQICPVILSLTEADDLVEFHTGAVALMSKMAPLLGAEATERLFMNRFASLCTEPVFYVRKVCANNFGDFCAVVGTTATEEFLLPYFVELCTDGVWGVRKACAEVITSVSVYCTLQTRKDTLAPVFNNLLLDQSRWVRMSAFQALGEFIATFIRSGSNNMLLTPHDDTARQDNTRLHTYSPSECRNDLRTTTGDDTASVLCSQSYHFPNETFSIMRDSSNSSIPSIACHVCCMQQTGRIHSMENINPVSHATPQCCETMKKTDVDDFSDNRLGHVHNCDKNLVENNQHDFYYRSDSIENDTASQNFNTFQYWRVPIPELELSDSVVEDSPIVLSRVTSNDSSISSCLPNTQLDAKAAVKLKLQASVLKQDHLIDDENQNPTDAHSCASEQCADNVDTSTAVLETQGNHHSDDILRRYSDCSIPEMQDIEGNQMSVKENYASFNKPDVWNESDYIPHKALRSPGMTFSRKHLTPRSTPLNTEEKLMTVFESLKQSTSSFSSEKTLGPCSHSLPAFYQERKHCISDNEVEHIISYHERKSETLVAHILQSDVPSNHLIQDIVPHYLVDHFVSMTHPSQAQNTDNEITHHCAFSIPAVALTLGRTNWHLIKQAYEALASDVQWKVRRTVAASIHELAVILGEELAGADLVPVFNGFIKDLDEVRIGALRHLADFLRLLHPAARNPLLHRLSDFHLTDNECNWRFRSELAEQLLHSVVLFTPGDTHEHITPLSILLLMDKVAAVRKRALSLVTQLVHHVSTEVTLVRNLLAELAEQFAHNKHWNRRQSFALLCSELMSKHVLKDEHFASDVFPHLLDLSWDPVPNVRLSVAHTLACDIAVQPYFSRLDSPHTEVLIQCLRRLQEDQDKDVQYFASLYLIPDSPVHFKVSCDGEN